MTTVENPKALIEEVILSGFHEGHVALRNPPFLAEIAAKFIQEKSDEKSIEELAVDRVSHNHLAYLMAAPEERLRDEVIEEYAELAEYILRAMAFAVDGELKKESL